MPLKYKAILAFVITLTVTLVTADWIHQNRESDNEYVSPLPASRPAPPPISVSKETTKDTSLHGFSDSGTQTIVQNQANSPSQTYQTSPAPNKNQESSFVGQTGTVIGGSSPQTQFSTLAAAQLQSTSNGASPFPSDARPAPLPLAFRELPPEVAASNPQLAAAVQKLQQNFIDAVGGPNQDPNDPGYYNRWTAALPNIDEQYRLLVGNQAFLLQQIKINQN